MSSPAAPPAGGATAADRAALVARAQARLAEDLLACDLLVTLFVQSLNSFRNLNICKPFPARYAHAKSGSATATATANGAAAGASSEPYMLRRRNLTGKERSSLVSSGTMLRASIYTDDGLNRDFASVKQLYATLPPLQQLAANSGARVAQLPDDTLYLLDWLINPTGVRVRSVPSSAAKTLPSLARLLRSGSKLRPTHVFSVEYDPALYTLYADFAGERRALGAFTAFHGSPLQNFHSIMRRGLVVDFAKLDRPLHGIFLAEDPAISEHFLAMQKTWDKSALGAALGCIAVCDVLDHPEEVTRCNRGDTLEQLAKQPENAVRSDYVVVFEEDRVRLSHLVVYSDGSGGGNGARRNYCMWLLALYVLLIVWLSYGKSTSYHMLYEYI